MAKLEEQQQFWKDEPELYIYSKLPLDVIRWGCSVSHLLILGLLLFFIYRLSPLLVWAWIVSFIISISAGYYSRTQMKLRTKQIAQIQQRALELSGAEMIGSAIHVAGHPHLEREQNIVLALSMPNLLIYSYESDRPLVIIPLQQIVAIQTVVYDDDRIPHVDVIDSTAQAIQLTQNYDGYEIHFLLRRMKKVRPIDWYHAIQEAIVRCKV